MPINPLSQSPARLDTSFDGVWLKCCLLVQKLSEVFLATFHRSLSALICILCILTAATTSAQVYRENDVKAALLLQVLRNLQWQNEAPQGTLNIAVWRDVELQQDFSQLAEFRVREQSIQVKVASELNEVGNPHLLYISEPHLNDLGQLAFSLRGKGVLLVTEQSPTLHNIMLNLLVEEQDTSQRRLSFQINRPNIAYENITVSPDLILHGGSEIDVAELYHQTEQAIQDLQLQNQSVFEALSQQRKAYVLIEQEYNGLQQQSVALRQQVRELQNALDSKQASIARNEQRLLELSGQAVKAEAQFTEAQALLEQKEKELKQSDRAQQEYESRIKEQRSLLSNLQDDIRNTSALLNAQRNQLEQAKTEVASQSALIDKQRDAILAILIVFGIALFAAFLIFYLFVKNKRINAQLQSTLNQLTNTQEQLVEAEKMASLGQLVTGVAHEINTPIGTSLTAISTLGADAAAFRQQIEEGKLRKSSAFSFVDKIEQLDALVQTNLQRCHRLVESFKQVSADQFVEEKRDIHLRDYCESIMQALSSYLSQNRVSWEVKGDNPIHRLDPGLLSQVINNFTTNAINHAFPGLTDKSVAIALEDRGQEIRITFSDNGVGMSDSIKQRIFDPFYTTKRGKGGTGLGLNIVYTIVTTKLDGQISVHSAENSGTRFVITLERPNQAETS